MPYSGTGHRGATTAHRSVITVHPFLTWIRPAFLAAADTQGLVWPFKHLPNVRSAGVRWENSPYKFTDI